MAKGDLSREAAAAAAQICACFHVRRAARAVTRLYDECLQPSGLRSTQFVILVAIHAEGVVALPALSETLGLDRSVLTRGLAPLEREGLVNVQASPAAGPSQVRLTAKGVRRLNRAAPLWQEAQRRFEGNLGGEEWGQVLGQLDAVRRAAER